MNPPARDYSRIFLLSHMRAMTSLAGHILGSHPLINGYFEMHISYEDAGALDRQLALYRQHESLKAGSRYIFDKLLHNDYRLKPERLGTADIRILVSLREPEKTIKSIVNLFARKDTVEPYASPDAAARYYTERLEALAGFCCSAGRRYCYYDAELFQSAPDELLAALSTWLELASPLSPDYRIFNQTGKARAGDSSEHIASGTVKKTETDYSHIRIPEASLESARAVYERCRRKIIDHATDSIAL